MADAEFYTSQRQADAEAYQIAQTAEAQMQSLRVLLEELDGKGVLAEQYIQFMIAQELKENSKWIISSDAVMGDVQSRLIAVDE